MYIRYSNINDKEIIKELMMLCFGEREDFKVFDNLDKRYLLAFEGDKLIGMSGLYYSKEFNACEIDWTCTHPDFRHRGVMHEIFKRMCSLVDEDIYCSCWRLGNKDKINLYSLMKDFGFEEIIRNRVSCRRPYNCKESFFCVGCFGEDCNCCEDLYLRKAIKNK